MPFQNGPEERDASRAKNCPHFTGCVAGMAPWTLVNKANPSSQIRDANLTHLSDAEKQGGHCGEHVVEDLPQNKGPLCRSCSVLSTRRVGRLVTEASG